MNTFNKEAYLRDYRNHSRLMKFGVALQERLPKKYHAKVVPLIRAYPRLGELCELETTTVILGILWECPAGEIPRLLQLMFRQSRGEITYRIGELQPGVGIPVQITFAFPELSEEQQ